MQKITQKQLIASLKNLKEIKPRKEWAVLLKSQILAEKPVLAEKQTSIFAGIADTFSSVFFTPRGTGQRKLAYSFAIFAFLIVGVFGFASYTVPGDLLFPVKKVTEQSTSALIGQSSLKNDVSALNSRINDLANVAKADRTDNIPSAISEVDATSAQLVKNLQSNLVNDSATIKEIAAILKTLASVQGTDLTANPEVISLYQIVVQSQIADLQKSTLTDDQTKILDEVKDLYKQEKYNDALEKILLINK